MLMLSQIRKDGKCNTRPIPQVPQRTPLTVHIDYLTVRSQLPEDKFIQLINFVERYTIACFPGVRWSGGNKFLIFENHIKGVKGVEGGYSICKETGLYDVMLRISGSYFERLSTEDQWRLVRGLRHAYQCTCSRIDIAVDDATFSKIPVDEMRKAWQEGNNFYFKKYTYIESGKNNETLQKTHYFGSRESSKLVRVYNHEGEFLRFEVEFKRKSATAVFEIISELQREWMEFDNWDCETADWIVSFVSKLKNNNQGDVIRLLHGCKDGFEIFLQKAMGAMALGAIDFRDKSSRKDRNKASRADTKRLNFYQEFYDNIGLELRVRVLSTKTTIDKTLAWMQKQVSKTLSVIYDGLGSINAQEFIQKLLANGRERQNFYDLKKIKYIQENKQLVSVYIK